MTEAEIEAAIAEWHDAPEGSLIAEMELHEHLGWTWDEYRAWASGGKSSAQSRPAVKVWFNRRWPYYRLCLHQWCWRFQTHDQRCHIHQGDA